MASAAKRLPKELAQLQALPPGVHSVELVADNLLNWRVLLCPVAPPFNNAAFELDLIFTEKYPFEPPKLSFKTPIYHPNVDETGAVCFDLVNPQNWKPATKMAQVLEGLGHLICEPEPSHPLRQDLAAQFLADRAKFNKVAAEHAKKQGLKRPA